MASNLDGNHGDRHHTLMRNQIYDYWKDGKYCDVILKIGQSSLKCHKVIVAACFEYFRGLFDMNSDSVKLDENVCDETLSHNACETYVLNDVDFNKFCQLIEYAYTGKINITQENEQIILILADYFGNNDIKRECETLMSGNISYENYKAIISFADQYSLPNLLTCALNFVGKNFDTLLYNGELQSMSLESFMKLYKTEDLLVLRKHVLVSPKLQEQYLFRAALLYCINRPEIERESILCDLLKNIRLPIIGVEALMEESKQYESMLSYPSVKQLIDLAFHIAKFGPTASRDEDVPSMWKSQRILSHWHVVDLKHRLASGNRVGFPEKWIDERKDIGFDEQIHIITIWTRSWCNTKVVSGIEIRYRSGRIAKCGGRVEDPSVFEGEDVIELEDGEVITKVSGRHGWLIDCIEFHTNLDRMFGSFGGNGGNVFSCSIMDTLNGIHNEYDLYTFNFGYIEGEHKTKSRYPEDSILDFIDKTILVPYLHGITAGEVLTNDHIAITHLGFLWLVFN